MQFLTNAEMNLSWKGSLESRKRVLAKRIFFTHAVRPNSELRPAAFVVVVLPNESRENFNTF